jgi:hypothetical protein
LDVPASEAAAVLGGIVAGDLALAPVDRRRTWSTTACGPVAVAAGGWRCVFQVEDGSLDRLDAIHAPDGRKGCWTGWLAEGQENPLMLLGDGEQQELELRLQACR